MTPRWLTLGARRVRPGTVDVAVPVIALFFVVGAHFRLDRESSLTSTLVFGLISAAVLVFRRRQPVPVQISLFLVLIVAAAIGEQNEPLLLFPLLGLFTVANQTDRRTTVVAGAITAALLYGGIVVQAGIGWDQGASLGVIAWTGMFAAVGDAARNRRSYVEAIEDRARKAESERDSEAARQVAEERLRIARELHDVLAHHIAVIHVHAGLADAPMSTAPATSKESLGYIRQAAGDVLSELQALIPVLRSPDDQGAPAGAPTPPTPGLDRLDDLIDSHRHSGSPVRVSVTGKPLPLSSAADLAAYRIIQEALTNATKHGVPGTAELGIVYTDDHLGVRVTNLVAAAVGEVPGTGHGLVGMRERAASVGADLTTGRLRDVFTVDLNVATRENAR